MLTLRRRVDLLQEGNTSLHIATSSGLLSVVEILLGGRADVNLKNKASRAENLFDSAFFPSFLFSFLYDKECGSAKCLAGVHIKNGGIISCLIQTRPTLVCT
jgi:hypothetical protein